MIWARPRQNKQDDLCAKRRLRSDSASDQSDQSSLSPWSCIGSLATLERTAKTLISRAHARADLSLRWAHMSCFVSFVVLWLSCYLKWHRDKICESWYLLFGIKFHDKAASNRRYDRHLLNCANSGVVSLNFFWEFGLSSLYQIVHHLWKKHTFLLDKEKKYFIM